MKILRGREAKFAVPVESRSTAPPKVTLGTFDGVHLGHQYVLQQLVTWAHATNGSAVTITFDRRPRETLGDADPEHLTSLRHRLLLLEQQHVDLALVLEFDESLAACEAEDFVREIIVDKLGADGVLLGHDTRFGRGGQGNVELMERLGNEMGFGVCSVPVVAVDGLPVSSTRIRAAIRSGNLGQAARLLGRPVSTLGTVVRGTGRGKEFGYPTANLDLHHEVRLPEGVYATKTGIHGRWIDSLTNIGRPPSLLPTGSPWLSAKVVIETYLLDFSDDLYGEEIEVRFLSQIRPERAFTSAAALIKAIAADVETARPFHGADPEHPGPIT